MTGRRLNLKHIKAGFGDYIEASTDEIVTNDMKGRTHGCISLDPSGNWQGSQVYFDLETGRVVLRRNIKVLPLPDCIIQVIKEWGKSQKNTDFKNKLEFWDRLKQKYDFPQSLITWITLSGVGSTLMFLHRTTILVSRSEHT